MMNKIYHQKGMKFRPLMKLLLQDGVIRGLQRRAFFTRRRLSDVLKEIDRQKWR